MKEGRKYLTMNTVRRKLKVEKDKARKIKVDD